MDGRGKALDGQREGGFPDDYHDYVFRDGKLIGDFDNMYRYAGQVPWEQDTRCDRWDTEVGMLMLADRGPYQAILEVGCGLGYIAAKLKNLTVSDGGVVDAFDVSPEAIRRAKALHPRVRYYVDNIAEKSFRPQRQYDLVVVKDVFWYVFERMARVVRNISDCVKPGGLLYVGQCFPALDGPFVGKDVIDSPQALIKNFSGFEPLYTTLLRNHPLVKDGPILHFVGTRST